MPLDFATSQWFMVFTSDYRKTLSGYLSAHVITIKTLNPRTIKTVELTSLYYNSNLVKSLKQAVRILKTSKLLVLEFTVFRLLGK